LIELGPEKFFAEMQQDPKLHGVGIYTLTPKIIMSRAQDRPASIVPDWAQVVICATDVNRSYALSTVIIAFGANQVSAVLWYGLHKMNVTDDMTEIEHRRLIYEALAVHGKKIASLTCRPDYWVIDGGGSPEGCVIRFAYNAPQICGLQASCCFGRGWKNFPKTIPKRHKTRAGEMLYMVSERRDRRWIIFHADFWREVAQKGWLAEPGSPGSCSLPAGHHEELAQQICREQLSGKEEVGDRMVWVFNTAPGKHDLGDCMTMAYMAASTKGYGTGGAVPSSSRRKKYTQKDLRR